jgi:hypothetical protein
MLSIIDTFKEANMSSRISNSGSEENDTPQRLFYWISMLVVLLFVGQAVLDAFDVHLFPHRAWAQGISPTVIQVPGGPAIYYQYILVPTTAANLKFELPDGAQSSFLGVAAVIQPSDKRAKILLRLLTLPEDLFLLAVVWLLRSIVLAAWGNPIDLRTPFSRANVMRLRVIAGFIAVLWIYHLFLPQLIERLSVYTVLKDISRIGEEPPWFSFASWGPLGVAVLLVILSQVFSHGARLQNDVEGLV